MSLLLKRTKKSCLKLLRRFSPSKEPSAQRLEEEDASVDNIVLSSKTCNTRIPRAESKVFLQEVPENVERAAKCDSISDVLVDDESGGESALMDRRYPNTLLHCLTSDANSLLATANDYELFRCTLPKSDCERNVDDATATATLAATNNEYDLPQSIVFQKVKYKKHVRYLRHTPSTSSLSDCTFNGSISNSPEHTVNADALKGLEDPNSNISQGLQRPSLPQNVFLPINVISLGLKTDLNYQNVLISEQRDCFNKVTPIVKWEDINGNSLDDDFPVFINDNWDEFDNNMNPVHDRRLDHFKSDEDSQKSSFRSNSTIETWLDDDAWDNPRSDKLQMQINLCLTKA